MDLSTRMPRGIMPVRSIGLEKLSQTALSLRQLFIHCSCKRGCIMMKYLVVFQTEYCGVEEIVIYADDFFSAVEVAKMAWMQDDNRVKILAIRQMKY